MRQRIEGAGIEEGREEQREGGTEGGRDKGREEGMEEGRNAGRQGRGIQFSHSQFQRSRRIFGLLTIQPACHYTAMFSSKGSPSGAKVPGTRFVRTKSQSHIFCFTPDAF